MEEVQQQSQNEVIERAQKIGNDAVGLMKCLAPGRVDIIFVALTLQLVQLTGVLYGQRAAQQLSEVLQQINRNGAPKIPSA